MQSTQAEKSQLESKIASMQLQLQAQIQGITEAHMQEMQSMKSQKKDLEMDLQMQKAQLTNLQVQLADSESKTLKLENNLTNVNRMFTDIAARFSQAQEGVKKLPILEAQLESLISDRDTLQKE